jgi:hypothetical protein
MVALAIVNKLGIVARCILLLFHCLLSLSFLFSPLLSHKTKQNKTNPLTHFWYFAFVFGTWNVDMSLCKLHFFFCYCDNNLGLVLILMLFVLSVCEGVEIFFVFLLLWWKRSGNKQFNFSLVSLGEFVSLHWKCSNYSNIHGSNKFGFVRRICWSALEMFKLLRHTGILHGRTLYQQWVLIVDKTKILCASCSSFCP